jgi:hypothetical protein
MSNRKFAIKVLEEKGEIIISCNGNSMRPIIAPKEAIHLKKVDHKLIRVGDAVFCKINGNYQVHKVSAIDEKENRFQISNNKGWVNGWTGANNIYGLAVKIEDRILVSDEELEKRKPVFSPRKRTLVEHLEHARFGRAGHDPDCQICNGEELVETNT